MEEKTSKITHRLQISERKKGSFTGVRDVNSFDEKEISLVIEGSVLTVQGEGLHVTRLDLEKQEVDIQGKVDSLIYSQGTAKSKGGEGMLKRLFR
nr:YabP/YqfC family sporulation protein [uncultured Blautia sp.]